MNASRNAASAASGVTAGERLETDDARVPGIRERRRDAGVADLAGPRLAAAGDVGHLDLADPGQGLAAQLHEVPLADLGVVEVEVEPQVG